MKYEGFDYPTHFFKEGGSGIRNNFLESITGTKCFFIHYLLQIKHSEYSIGTFCVFLATSIKKTHKVSRF